MKYKWPGWFDFVSFSINDQTKLLTNFSEWKMFQIVQMKEEKVIIYSNNSLQCGYLKSTSLPLKAILNLFSFGVFSIWMSGETHIYHLLRSNTITRRITGNSWIHWWIIKFLRLHWINGLVIVHKYLTNNWWQISGFLNALILILKIHNENVLKSVTAETDRCD